MTDILGLIRELLEVEKAKATVDRKTDSVEVGTPSKGGALKVYFDASDPEEGKRLVDNAYTVREYAQKKLWGGCARMSDGKWTASSPTGGEYEHCAEDRATVGPLYFRPKREHTGWVCSACNAPCVYKQQTRTPPTGCPSRYGPHETDWQPFYGTIDDPDAGVVE